MLKLITAFALIAIATPALARTVIINGPNGDTTTCIESGSGRFINCF